MKIPRIVTVLSCMDDDLVLNAAKPPKKATAPLWLRIGAIAACFALIVGIAFTMRPTPFKPVAPSDPGSQGTTTETPSTSTLPGSTTTPPTSGSQENTTVTSPTTTQQGSTTETTSTNNTQDNETPPIGGPGLFSRYYQEPLYDVYILSYLLSWEEIDIFTEEFHKIPDSDQLPTIYYYVKGLNIQKEDFIRINNERLALRMSLFEEESDIYTGIFTNEQIELIFSDADLSTIKRTLKLDTAFLYEDWLYNIYELKDLDATLLKEMSEKGELLAYLDYMYALAEEKQEEYNSIVGGNQGGYDWFFDVIDAVKAKIE